MAKLKEVFDVVKVVSPYEHRRAGEFRGEQQAREFAQELANRDQCEYQIHSRSAFGTWTSVRPEVKQKSLF